MPVAPPSVEVNVAVPVADVAVPALHVAVVGDAVAEVPRAVIVIDPTLLEDRAAAVTVLLSTTVAVAVEELLKLVSNTVWPDVPVTVQPPILGTEIEATPVAVQL